MSPLAGAPVSIMATACDLLAQLFEIAMLFCGVIFVECKSQNHVFVNNDSNGLQPHCTQVICAYCAGFVH
jgi:hypothetical protein